MKKKIILLVGILLICALPTFATSETFQCADPHDPVQLWGAILTNGTFIIMMSGFLSNKLRNLDGYCITLLVVTLLVIANNLYGTYVADKLLIGVGVTLLQIGAGVLAARLLKKISHPQQTVQTK